MTVRPTVASEDWRWLAFASLSAITLMVVGIQDAAQRRLPFALLGLFTLLPIAVTRSLNAVGITRRNIGTSILVGSIVGIVYGMIRGLMLRLVPSASLILGADLARIVTRLETGTQIGRLLATGPSTPFLSILFIPGLAGLELYFRGFLFPQLRRHIHWAGAVAAISIVQAISRRTPHSLILGSIAGVLMQKYDNVFAPASMHLLQFFVALAIILYS